ncbi:MAG: Crp/Fnr family transcriptional regulator [Mesorhizobium sp.]
MNSLAQKLQSFEKLSEADLAVLENVIAKTRQVDARQDLIEEGDVPTDVLLVLEGFACRYKLLANGRRHIFSYMIAGDFCDLHGFIFRTMDHSVATLTTCTVVDIPRRTVLDLTEHHPRIARGLMWSTLVDQAVLREWLVNMGQRSAVEATAHLLCEMLMRLEIVGLVSNGHYQLPLTQTDLADTLGISIVHTNRSLKALREAGLVEMIDKAVYIPNIEKLKAFSGFTANYLHIGPGKVDIAGVRSRHVKTVTD